MKDLRAKFNQPHSELLSEEELEQLWQEATVILDANVLLDLHRYNPSASREMLNNLSNMQERIWIPYQFASEYLRLCNNAIPNQYEIAQKKLERAARDMTKATSDLRKETKLKHDRLDQRIENFLESSTQEIKKLSADHTAHHEKLPRQIDDVLEGSIGNEPTHDELLTLYQVSQMRYDMQIPPGYKDTNKVYNRYGDVIGWLQMLAYAKDTNKSVIFITSDTKEDWFVTGNNQMHPRVELIQEMKQEAGVNFYAYNIQTFARKLGASEETIEEVINVLPHPRSFELKLQIFHRIQSTDDVLDAIKELKTNIISSIRSFNAIYHIEENKGIDQFLEPSLSKINRDIANIIISPTQDNHLTYETIRNQISAIIGLVEATSNITQEKFTFVYDAIHDQLNKYLELLNWLFENGYIDNENGAVH